MPAEVVVLLSRIGPVNALLALVNDQVPVPSLISPTGLPVPSLIFPAKMFAGPATELSFRFLAPAGPLTSRLLLIVTPCPVFKLLTPPPPVVETLASSICRFVSVKGAMAPAFKAKYAVEDVAAPPTTRFPAPGEAVSTRLLKPTVFVMPEPLLLSITIEPVKSFSTELKLSVWLPAPVTSGLVSVPEPVSFPVVVKLLLPLTAMAPPPVPMVTWLDEVMLVAATARRPPLLIASGPLATEAAAAAFTERMPAVIVLPPE